MRYYSDELKKFFDTEDECNAAEAELKKLSDEKEERRKEVDKAFEVANKAREAAYKMAKKYAEDYGSYTNTADAKSSWLADVFDTFFGD